MLNIFFVLLNLPSTQASLFGSLVKPVAHSEHDLPEYPFLQEHWPVIYDKQRAFVEKGLNAMLSCMPASYKVKNLHFFSIEQQQLSFLFFNLTLEAIKERSYLAS